MSQNSETQKDYSETLYLPHTDLPMRAGLPQKEPEMIARWDKLGLYKRLREQSEGREKFVLHDGPPYANGNLHIGHALNKILKDIINRSFQMRGFDAPYVPGWDCHGLPIEWKVEEKYRAKGKNKDEIPVNEFRAECRAFAEEWVKIQAGEFRRLGVEGDFANPYTTMAFRAEARIAGELMKFATTGQLYRGSKPVMWSVVEKTALAEAEVEYHLHESDTVWVKFPVAEFDSSKMLGPGQYKPSMNVPDPQADLRSASIVIWTTTPWTIPANRAISFSSKISYGLYEVTAAENDFGPQAGDKLIFAKKLADECFQKAKLTYEYKFDIPAESLATITCDHPLKGHGGGYGFKVPLLDGDHVTDEAGTGFVHTAPGHGRDDFDIWMASARKLNDLGIETTIPYCVDEDSAYTADAPGFEGARVFDDKGKKGDANTQVITALIERNNLFARGRVKHEYPHSWRSKKPVIYRNTPQWFVYMDKDIDGAHGDTLRKRAFEAIAETRFVPPQGQNRLRAMIENRPDWVLSRQRAWGVPITVFVNKETGEILKDDKVNERIFAAFEAEGADAWFVEGARARFLAPEYNPDDFEKVTDILDVWFDSGSTHSFVLEDREELKWPADLYLEGSDQHRGWFHSSLLESCGTRRRAPYNAVLTHGFTMDGEGRKMSKSLGNVVVPQEITQQFGADILRLWVASTDYSDDQRLGDEIIKGNVDAYRKLRNTLRWLLGSLAHYNEDDAVAFDDMPPLERYMLGRLYELSELVDEAYNAFDFKRIYAALSNFMITDCSAFYFDIRKDALYCDAPSSKRRKACLTVLDRIFNCLTIWLAPIVPFTAEEVWLTRYPSDTDSVHFQLFPEVPSYWQDEALAEKWAKVRKVRRVVTGALEVERRAKTIGSSLEAAPKVFITDEDLFHAVSDVGMEDVCIVSQIEITDDSPHESAFVLEDVKDVAVVFRLATGKKCARSWKISDEVGKDADYPDVTLRDAEALRERAKLGLPV